MNPQDTIPGTPQQQVIERLKTAVNVLVTVSNNPSVDQLAAAIAFTLVLNKLGKHATAVFSGQVPSTLEFLKPEATIEKNTDSLRDFIISLDKAKADKLRYKVEENVVKIFITPYRTSLSDKDLIFSQGDFNVDAVVALGVIEREQLDQAIISHGRILHDATVITVSAGQASSSLGAINWQDNAASSLCEMLVSVGDALQPGLLDNQIATAYLTGIVAQTERFRNEKTTPKLMTMAAQLMAAGANQQLIATSLEKTTEVPLRPEPVAAETAVDNPDGSLTIEHQDSPPETLPIVPEQQPIVDQPAPELQEEIPTEIAIDEHGNLGQQQPVVNVSSNQMLPLAAETPKEQTGLAQFAGGSHPFSSNLSDDGEDEPNTDPLTAGDTKPVGVLLEHTKQINRLPKDIPAEEPNLVTTLPSVEVPTEMVPEALTLPPLPEPVVEVTPESTPEPAPVTRMEPISVSPPMQPVFVPEPIPEQLPDPSKLMPAMDNSTLRDIEINMESPHITKDPHSTLNEIEEAVSSPHLKQQSSESNVESARDAVQDAIQATPYDPSHPEPLQALNASPLSLGHTQPSSNDPVLAGLGLTDSIKPNAHAILPPPPAEQFVASVEPQSVTFDPTGHTPPPVPPPMITL